MISTNLLRNSALNKLMQNKDKIIYGYRKWNKEVSVLHIGDYYRIYIFNTRTENLIYISSFISNKLEALCYAEKKRKWLILEPYSGQTICYILCGLLYVISFIALILSIYE